MKIVINRNVEQTNESPNENDLNRVIIALLSYRIWITYYNNINTLQPRIQRVVAK